MPVLLEIVLIEDNSADRELTLRSLHQSGLSNSVVVCTDGEQAMRLVLRQGEYATRPQIGLVLLDLNLPKVNGFDVLAMIRANPETSKVPVIGLTGSHEAPDIAEARKLGADHYMVKPVDFCEVVELAKDLAKHWLSLATRAQHQVRRDVGDASQRSYATAFPFRDAPSGMVLSIPDLHCVSPTDATSSSDEVGVKGPGTAELVPQ